MNVCTVYIYVCMYVDMYNIVHKVLTPKNDCTWYYIDLCSIIYVYDDLINLFYLQLII